MESRIVLKGKAILELRRNGKVIEREEVNNLVVNAGKERVAKLLGAIGGVGAFSHLAIGTGTTSATATDTALETEIERQSATIAYEADYKATFEYTFTFGSGESYAITEAGITDSATESGSTFLDRFVFSAKNVDSDTDLYLKVTITVA